MMRLFFTSARHNARSCFSPALKFEPRLEMRTLARGSNIIHHTRDYNVPSSLTVENRLNLASAAGSETPSRGNSQARWSADINSASVRVPCGSLCSPISVRPRKRAVECTYRLSLRVPRKSVESWGTSAKRVLSASRPMSRMLIPSISMLPCWSSTILFWSVTSDIPRFVKM